MNIAMLTSEANPYSKTGGLGDVTYSLSASLKKLGENVIIVLPLYRKIKDVYFKQMKEVLSSSINMSWRNEEFKVYKLNYDNIDYYFIDSLRYFNRDNYYGYDDDGERFAFFVLAAYQSFKKLKLSLDIVHLHDWQTAFFSVLVKENHDRFYKNTKTVLTIHNPAFLGMMDGNSISELFNLNDELFTSGKVRYQGRLSTLKSGIVYADKIITVSRTHREELLTKEGGKGLNDVLKYRRDDFLGIVNGIDYTEFNPTSDRYLINVYNQKDYFNKKKLNKKALLTKMKIKNSDKPLFSLISRLTSQKGIELAIFAMEEMVKKGCTAIVLGSGEYELEQKVMDFRNRYPDNVAIYIGYNNELAHQIYASGDFFMMPSLFEPCGLSQMISERYGTLPIVRATGGLNDTVIGYDGTNEETANGFRFVNYNSQEMLKVTQFAYETYFNLPILKKLMKNAMKKDNSWKKSAIEYQKVYYQLVRL